MIVAIYRVFTQEELQQSTDDANFAHARASGEPFGRLDNASEEAGLDGSSDSRRGDDLEPELPAHKRLYFARFTETKYPSEAIPALRSIINEINDLFKCKSVYRMHGDRASELTGEAVTNYFEERGVRVTETAGYEPNANGRAESAVGVIKTKARVMLMSLGSVGKVLWPAAVQHACWCTRRDTKCRSTLVPAFGETITAKIKNTPHDSFEARGKDVKFLGCLDKVTAGVLTGVYNGEGWDLEVFSTYVLHGVVEPSGADGQEEIVIDEEELNQDKKKNVTWHSDTYMDKSEVPEAIVAEPSVPRHRPERGGVVDPRRAHVFEPKPETTYKPDAWGKSDDATNQKKPKGERKGKVQGAGLRQ